ncbi:MAG: hypothetical protein RL095_2410 [Verrucomicrobiota bacterium]|jgi:pimeloyl-ACP methyl ester carboxylesterase
MKSLLFSFLLAVCLQAAGQTLDALASTPARVLKADEVLPSLNAEQKAIIDQMPKTPQFARVFDYGWIETPEDWSQPDSRRIRIFYMRLKANPQTPSLPPAIYFNGGPGMCLGPGSALNLMGRDPQRDFIVIHQRGTGCSSPFPEASDEASIRRLAHYLSSDIVKDSEALRRSLYGDKTAWAVVGQSFGSFIGHRYLELAPASITSLHLHGVAPSQNAALWPELRLRSHGALLKQFLIRQPEGARRLKLIRQHLQKNPSAFTVAGLTCKGEHMLGLVGLLHLTPDGKSLDNLLRRLCPKDQVNEKELIATVRQVNIDVLNFHRPSGTLNIIFNRLEGYGAGRQSLSAFYQGLFQKLAAEGDDPRLWLIGEEALAHNSLSSPAFHLADTLDFGPAKSLDPKKIAANLREHPSITFRLYSGEFDTISPPAAYQDMQKTCGQGLIYTLIPNSDHGGFMADQPFWQDLRRQTAAALPIETFNPQK